MDKSGVITLNDLPGFRVTHALGIVQGTSIWSSETHRAGPATVPSDHGHLAEVSAQQKRARDGALEHLVSEANALGANAVIGMRYQCFELHAGYVEVHAYGTAVYIRPAAS